MKSKILSISLVGTLCAMLTGCTIVPKTMVAFDPKTGAIKIQSPKNVSIGEATATQNTNGTFSITVKNYSSTNDNSVVSSVASANAAALKVLADSAQASLATAIQASK